MALVKVAILGTVGKSVSLDPKATDGATIGTNLKLPNGDIATKSSLVAFLGVGSSTSSGITAHRLLEGLALGDDHPQYTRKDTLTTRGDLYTRGVSTVQRLGIGTNKQVLSTDGTDAVWQTKSPVVTLSTDLSGNATLTDLGNATLAATIVAHAVTDGKIRQSAGLSLIGRSANTTGDVADITAGSDGDVLRRSGTILGFGTIDHTYISDFDEAVQDVVGVEFVDSSEIDFTYNDTLGTVSASLINGSVAYARLADLSALSILGRSANSSGIMAAITAGTDGQTLRRSGTSIAFGALDLASANAITGDLPFANLTQGSALSVLGVTGNATADLASIVAGSDGDVLRRSGTAVGFGAIPESSVTGLTTDLAAKALKTTLVSAGIGLSGGGDLSTDRTISIATNGVTDALLRQSAGLSLIGRSANTTGNVADITAASDGNVLRRSGTALSFGAIDISSSNAVTNRLAFANLTQGSARSVLAVAGASTADFASVSAGNDDTLLGRTSGSLSFGQLTVGMLPANVVTYAKIQQVSATSRVLGRITAGAGNIEELTGANLATIIGTSLGANPSASVGLVAVNGTAGTYMRSDGAPALDQGVAPTWTAQHVFTAAYPIGADNQGGLVVKSVVPMLEYWDTNAAANEKRVQTFTNSGQFQWRTISDDGQSANSLFVFNRTGISVTSMFYGNTTDNPTHTFQGPVAYNGATLSTGASVPTIGTNKPGSAVSLAPSTWETVVINGTTYYRPLWI